MRANTAGKKAEGKLAAAAQPNGEDAVDGSFASSPSTMQAYAKRTVGFLTAIEDTVNALEANRTILATLVAEARLTLESLAKADHDSDIDPDGKICDSLRDAAASATRIYDQSLKRRDAAHNAQSLSEDDGVVEAFSRFIEAVADYHNVLEDLRDAIATLDASRATGVSKTFRSAGDLMDDVLGH